MKRVIETIQRKAAIKKLRQSLSICSTQLDDLRVMYEDCTNDVKSLYAAHGLEFPNPIPHIEQQLNETAAILAKAC